MKKITIFLVATLVLVGLVGCSDAQVEIKDKNEALFTIGDTTIRKNQLFDLLVERDAGYSAVSMATNFIWENEIEITDEMRENADSTLEFYKMIYQDSFLTTIQASGFKDEEDFYENNLMASEKSVALAKKYVDSNFQTLVNTYKPRKAVVLSFSTEEEANDVKVALESGESVSDILSTHSSLTDGNETIYTTQSNLDVGISSYISDSEEPKISDILVGASVENFFIVQILETDSEAMREEVITALSVLSPVISECDLFYFNQYKFNVYDKTLLDLLTKNYSQYLK